MTDITELAQSLKAAAEKAKHAGEAPIMSFDARISALNEYQITVCPDNVLALVEALEKAQRANAAQDDHINQQQDRIDQLEKGHQEAAKQINSWRRMAKQNIAEREKDIAELDAARQRIAELESRTVKLPEPFELAGLSGGSSYYYADEVDAALTAQGIKVEAE